MYSIKLVSFASARVFSLSRCSRTGTGMSSTFGSWSDDTRSDIRTIKYPQYSPKDRNESPVKKRARLIWQSRKRGIKENCLIFGTFADEHLASFSSAQLDLYDDLLNRSDNEWDLYYWMTGSERVPEMFDNEIMDLLKKHCKNEGKEERFEQPTLNYQPVNDS